MEKMPARIRMASSPLNRKKDSIHFSFSLRQSAFRRPVNPACFFMMKSSASGYFLKKNRKSEMARAVIKPAAADSPAPLKRRPRNTIAPAMSPAADTPRRTTALPHAVRINRRAATAAETRPFNFFFIVCLITPSLF
jgi:hypothetical protein